jgi:RecA/RadA recombinase
VSKSKQENQTQETQLQKELIKQYGEGVSVSAREMLEEESFKKMVVPVGPALNVGLHGGIPEGSWITCSGQPKTGKEQPVSATTYTPSGPRRIGDLKVGDPVCHPDGDAAIVVGVFPQGIKPVYRITFDNGDTAECGLEHLWEVSARFRKNAEVIPLKEFKDDLYYKEKNNRWGQRPKWHVRLNSPVFFNSRPVPVHPYVVGLMLGNGHMGEKQLYFSAFDRELAVAVADHAGCEISAVKANNCDYRLTGAKQLKTALKRLGLIGRNSHTKYVPDCYLYNSVEVRQAVLQGLMDTDGTVDRGGGAEFTSVSQRLADQVKWLVQSLGGLCSTRVTRRIFNGKLFRSYRCHIRMVDMSMIFRLPRKKNRCQKRTINMTRRIVAVDYVRDEHSVCIKIDREDGLYLTDHFIVTHNTSTALSFAAQCQKPEYGGRHVYYLNIEGRLKEMNLKGTAGLNLDKFTIFRSTPDRILSAKDYLTLAMKCINTDPGCLVIIDSVSALCDEKEMDEGVGYENRGAGNKIFAGFCRQASNVVPVRNCFVWAILHLTQSQGMYGGFVEKGSRTLQYQADVQMRVKFDRAWKVGSGGNEKQIGQQVHWLIESCALGPPQMEVDSYIRYGIGIDNVYEAINLGAQLGLIGKAGAWMTLDYMERHLSLMGVDKWNDEAVKRVKTQGAEKLYKLLQDNPSWIAALESEINTMLRPS